MEPRRAVLRQPPLGDVEAGQNLDARDQRLRQRFGRRRHRAQQTVDAHAHSEAAAQRFDMDVAGAQLHRLFEQIVDGAHHGRAAGKIAQAVDAFVVAGALAFRRFLGPFRVRPQTLGERRRDVLERGDGDLDRPAEHDFHAFLRRDVVGIADRQAKSVLARRERKDRRFAQEPLGEAPGQRMRAHQLGQRQPRQLKKRGDFLGEVMGRDVARFPQLANGRIRMRIGPAGVIASELRGDQILFDEMTQERQLGTLPHSGVKLVRRCDVHSLGFITR